MTVTPEQEPRCWDCQVQIGEPHGDGCDVARCLWTGAQRLTCDMLDPEPHDCGHDVHIGNWPGTVECIEFGWYVRDTPNGLQRCGPDADGAMPNINRLHLRREARWDRDAGRFVLTGQVAL